ncbi:putative membrane protein [Flavobacterium sp. 2755]|nr:putative membrane protein [Flavobacterium sp. 2755]
MIPKIRLEIKTALYFVVYFIVAFIFTLLDSGNRSRLSSGTILFFLSVPISIICVIVLFFKLYESKETKYLNCIYVLTIMWALFFILLHGMD